LFDVSKISKVIYDSSKPLRKANWTVILLCFSTAATFWFFNALNKSYTTRVDYPIELVYNRDSLVMVKEPPREVPINVTGGGWQLFKRTISLNSVPVYLELENPVQTQYFTAGNLLPEFSNQLSDLNVNYIATDSIFFKIEPYADRKLAIQLDSGSISLRENFYITSSVHLQPDTVNFHGPVSLVKQLPEIFMVSLSERNISSSYDEELSLDLFSHSLIKKQPEVIHVNFEVEEFIEQNEQIDIEMVNFPHDSTIYLDQGKVGITFLIQKSMRNKTELGDFLIIADLKYVHAVDSTITLEIMDLPEYVKNINLLDKRVKVVYAK
jgi:hypothetical protein